MSTAKVDVTIGRLLVVKVSRSAWHEVHEALQAAGHRRNLGLDGRPMLDMSAIALMQEDTMASNAGREGPSRNDPDNPRPPGVDSQKGSIPMASAEAQGKAPSPGYGGGLDRGYTPKGPVGDTGGTPL